MIVRLSKYYSVPVRKCVGTYPQKTAFAHFHNTSDEQWEHYTDIEKKCKHFNGIVEVVALQARRNQHYYLKIYNNHYKEWLFLQLATAYFAPRKGVEIC